MSKEELHHRQATADDLKDVKATQTVHHESARQKREVSKEVGQLNLTSMMDVTFLLLIFFILTASFALNEGVLKAELPRGPGTPSPDTVPPKPIKIILTSRGMSEATIQVENAPQAMADFEGLYQWLSGNRRSGSNPNGIYADDDPVIIQPGTDVSWQHVIDAFNAATRARYKSVNFAEAR